MARSLTVYQALVLRDTDELAPHAILRSTRQFACMKSEYEIKKVYTNVTMVLKLLYKRNDAFRCSVCRRILC